MKYLLSLVLLTFVLIGCNSDSNKTASEKESNPFSVDSSELKTTAAGNQAEQFDMVYKFEKGSKKQFRVTQIQNQNMDYSGAENKKVVVHQSIIHLVTLETQEVDPDGTMDIKCTITNIKIDAKSDNETVKYESGVTKDTSRKFAKYDALVNNSFDIRVTKFGDITELSKVDRIVTKFIELNKLKEELKQEDKDYIKQGIIETAIKPVLVQLFRQVPEKKMAKDSLWVKNQPQSQMLTFVVTSAEEYKVNSLEMLENQKIAKINAVMKTSFAGETKTTQKGVNYEISKPIVESKGLIYFNIDKGYIQKSITSTKLQMTNKMSAQGRTMTEKQNNENKNIVELIN